MEAAEPCNVCSSTDLKLIDGFYYCVECGTQNTNIREIIVESQTLGDGTYAILTKKKIAEDKSETIQMSSEWYKWHAFNFVISGLADELVALGAKPSFKTKLLWIWTRYIKKYQNKEAMRSNPNAEKTVNATAANSLFFEEENSNLEEEETDTSKNEGKTLVALRDMDFVSRGLILAMLYLALNLDKSDIQISHLYRFVQEKQISIYNEQKFIPDDIPVKLIPKWLNFLKGQTLTGSCNVRGIVMSLLRTLDLGTAIVPDLRKIVDNFFKELCLPNDLKALVFSLMHYCPCNFLDIGSKEVLHNTRIPDYEVTIMSYILIALKICFGLDSNYENELSNIVDNINESKGLSKSHKIGKYSSSSDRLFSFREWCSFIEYRNFMVYKHLPHLNARHYRDIDDFIYFEHVEGIQNKEKDLMDKISIDIITKIPYEEDVGVIPKDQFPPTLTPLSDYTEIIIDHSQDFEKRLLLSEDFTQYSLKYAYKDLKLQDETEVILKGVNESGKSFNNLIRGSIKIKKSKSEMVYVRHCDNVNWMKTNLPNEEHIITESSVVAADDKDSDHGYDSEHNANEKDSNHIPAEIVNDISSDLKEENIYDHFIDTSPIADVNDIPGDLKNENINDNFIDASPVHNNTKIENVHDIDETTVDLSLKNGESDTEKLLVEEVSDQLIFDDDFVELNIKDEVDQNHVDDFENEPNFETYPAPEDNIDDLSDSSTYFAPFNPDTFDREGTIKELILCACKKFKIPVPAEYRVRDPLKRKLVDKTSIESGPREKRAKRLSPGEAKKRLEELINGYYNNLHFDSITKVQKEMELALQNALNNATLNLNDPPLDDNLEISSRQSEHSHYPNLDEIVAPSLAGRENSAVNDDDNIGEENLEPKLFEDESKINLDELKPKCDPKFDQNKYDINQMYVKIKNNIEDTDEFAVEDEELDQILTKKIEEYKDLKPQKKEKTSKNDIEDFDSEDEIPLTEVIETKTALEKREATENTFENLIPNDIKEFKYWRRQYDPSWINKSERMHSSFDKELKQNTPTSFYFVIHQCASVINSSTYHLYKNLQILEKQFFSRLINFGIERELSPSPGESHDSKLEADTDQEMT